MRQWHGLRCGAIRAMGCMHDGDACVVGPRRHAARAGDGGVVDPRPGAARAGDGGVVVHWMGWDCRDAARCVPTTPPSAIPPGCRADPPRWRIPPGCRAAPIPRHLPSPAIRHPARPPRRRYPRHAPYSGIMASRKPFRSQKPGTRSRKSAQTHEAQVHENPETSVVELEIRAILKACAPAGTIILLMPTATPQRHSSVRLCPSEPFRQRRRAHQSGGRVTTWGF